MKTCSIHDSEILQFCSSCKYEALRAQQAKIDALEKVVEAMRKVEIKVWSDDCYAVSILSVDNVTEAIKKLDKLKSDL